MRRVILLFAMTVNGRVDAMSDWFKDEAYSLAVDEMVHILDTCDTILLGRNTYNEFYPYWPDIFASSPADHADDRIHPVAGAICDIEKVVVTRQTSPTALEWDSARFEPASTDSEMRSLVEKLQGRPGGDIAVAGGVMLYKSLLRIGVVDEIRVIIAPSVSAGAGVFQDVVGTRDLDLLQVKSHTSGAVLLRYGFRSSDTVRRT